MEDPGKTELLVVSIPKAPCRYYFYGLGPNVGIICIVRAPGYEYLTQYRFET